MRAFGKSVAVGAFAATLVGMCLSAAGPAMADPLSTPSLTTLAGVGSDTVTPLFDNGTSSQPLGDAPGTLVHDYNATNPSYKVASWDAVNPTTGVAGDTITTKGLNSSDTSCNLTRPDGSGAGIAALDANQEDSNKVNGQTIYCLDYARSSRPPNTTTDNNNSFVGFAKDAIAWGYPKISGKTNPQPKALNLTDLENIYTCVWTNWDQIPGDSHNAKIGVVIPQSGSGTRATWLLQLGIPSTTVEPCWQNGTVVVGGNTDVIEENTGLSAGNVAQFTTTQDFGTTCAKGCAPQDDIYPYSIGDWIAQSPAANGVGGHATSIWGHGNIHIADTDNTAGAATAPTSKNSSGQLIINPKFSSHFFRTLYAVTRNSCFVSSNPTGSAACLPTTTPPAGGTAYPKYEANGLKAFFGPKGWLCTNGTAKADIVSYGFTRLGSTTCGGLTAGD
jgi:ABC-type phosphate transport system substrate-binding protein